MIEAMKMQHEIAAPFDGIVRAINVKTGQTVDGNAVLIEIERESIFPCDHGFSIVHLDPSTPVPIPATPVYWILVESS